jgi:hypothetical protein
MFALGEDVMLPSQLITDLNLQHATNSSSIQRKSISQTGSNTRLSTLV